MFAHEVPGYAYSRYDNPTNHALEELLTTLENGAGSLACSTGMAALQIAILTALLDRRKKVLAATALYGATINLLLKVMEPFGVETSFVDITDIVAVRAAIEAEKPGCVLMETVSNPGDRSGLLIAEAIGTKSPTARDADGAQVVTEDWFSSKQHHEGQRYR